jgi:hypothetical protein
MAAISHRHRIVYFPIPKNATSSMKRVLYTLDTGRPFSNKTKRALGASVHHLYPHTVKERWRGFYPAYTSIVIVRDPIKRFLSAYGNRVIHVASMKKRPKVAAALAREGLGAMPSLAEFVENLEQYRKISRYVRIHTIPQANYVGAFWSEIKHRVPIERIGDVPAIIKAATGQKVVLPHTQGGGPKPSVGDLSPRHFDKLVKFYRSDYDMLKGLYSPEQLR